mmetsp:Transcript_5246/g.12505  ORF Transcript_5246/g.12505 Transcript_5246/m.12505 type:complete len:404 (+) Transcript_5246:259-1470(+)
MAIRQLVAEVGVVVGGQMIGDKLSGTVSVKVVGHIVTLFHHVGTHLVEGRGRDEVALAVDLPGDRRVRRADGVVTGGTSGGSGVDGDINTHLHVRFDNHTLHEVGVVVVFVVDDDENLGVNTDGGGNVLGLEGQESVHIEVAEDTVVERSLELVGGSAGTGSRVRPVNLIGLSDFHALVTVLPLVRLGEHFFFSVVEVALVTLTGLSSELAAIVDGGRSTHGLFRQHTVVIAGLAIVLTGTVVLGTQVPVHVDGAETCLVVGLGDGDDINFESSVVSLGDVSSGLRSGCDSTFGYIGTIIESIKHAVDVGKIDLLLVASVDSCQSRLGDQKINTGLGFDGGARLVGQKGGHDHSPNEKRTSGGSVEQGVIRLLGFGIDHLDRLICYKGSCDKAAVKANESVWL